MKSTISPNAPINKNRFSFGKIPQTVEMPHLLAIQKEAYDFFLQGKTAHSKKKSTGLHAIFSEIFPINDPKGLVTLEYLGYQIGNWRCNCGTYEDIGTDEVVCPTCKHNVFYIEKNSEEECIRKGLTYSDALRIKVRMSLKEKITANDDPVLRDIKEEIVYMGEIPLMTKRGSFIINGTERVVVSQLHRSPGIFFSIDKLKSQAIGKKMHIARIIPYRGSWIDYEFDSNGILYVKIDKKKKFPATILLKALGFNNEGLLKTFYKPVTLKYSEESKLFQMKVDDPTLLLGYKPAENITDSDGEIVIKAGKKFTKSTVRKIKKVKGIEYINVLAEDLIGEVIGEDIVDEETGEIFLELNEEITEELLEKIKAISNNKQITEFRILNLNGNQRDDTIRKTLIQDKTESYEEAICDFYRRLRPSDPSSVELAKAYFHNIFFTPKQYDLSEVGRLKINNKFGEKIPLTQRVLLPEDIINTTKYLIDLKMGEGVIDDIDNLGNRRVRTVRESLENVVRIGLMKLEKLVTDRLNIAQDVAAMMPKDLLSAKPMATAFKEFFCSDPLSQFMDQTNPLSEITHKRRLSALGKGGLTRERAGFEVRDVHPTHYGRICPIETPEGPNIGLISSLATFAEVNEHGFIQTPYKKVVDGKLTDETISLTAMEENNYVIAQLTEEVFQGNREITSDIISARSEGEFVMVPPSEVDYMDISPKQMVSVAAALIPFLENDDANRALMGSNMQRQSVPLLKSEAPLVGTGMEAKVAVDSGSVVLAEADGTVVYADAKNIIVRGDANKNSNSPNIHFHKLHKFQRSNQNTCINYKPSVMAGDTVKKGQVIADGPNIENGELALGKNVLVAFMPWNGYNFEDAIIINERVVKDDVFTSLHIEELVIDARETKNGKEEVTREIPNCNEDLLNNLDESGIIKIGTYVKPNDILVGKITPKGESMLTVEEKLLKAIFGEKAGDYRDSSLRVGSGIEGTVIDVQIFTRKGEPKDSRSKYLEEQEVNEVEELKEKYEAMITEDTVEKLAELLKSKKVAKSVKVGNEELKKGDVLKKPLLKSLSYDSFASIVVDDEKTDKRRLEIIDSTNKQIRINSITCEEKIEKILKGAELQASVIKSVKVYVLIKRKLQVGDKMAGRHGNKGVVSIVVPEEDMPYMEDGRSIDIILNPLGVPSRMNVGQILETNLGLVAHEKKQNMATPIFDGAKEENIKEMLTELGFDDSGSMYLYDGKTGDNFDQKIVVGYIYMLKLHHLVEEKIHARSTGPYSLVTQQPLGGKAQFGGQRLGEMEVWALEAYGAAYTLQEMLTVKSDDTEGRKKMYENIVKGKHSLKPNLPESFNVLIRELQSLCLDVELIKEGKQ
ncbi:MAG: DNA-directed RNA polymerase subunit beta [Nitrospinae bacterium]|nr:DNA-directed RNA polymerase subunit beta [Nitrospinota bacterium]